jgi:hypothetical protein
LIFTNLISVRLDGFPGPPASLARRRGVPGRIVADCNAAGKMAALADFQRLNKLRPNPEEPA